MKRLLTIAALAMGFVVGGIGMTNEARADRDWDGRNVRYQRYWRDYDRWYGRSYRPYYQNYYRGYSQPYYNDNYYRTQRYGTRGYYGGGGVNVGPVRIFW
jgi:hypothetical protein